MGAEIFIEIAGRQDEEKALTSRCGLTACPAVEQGGVKGIILIRWALCLM